MAELASSRLGELYRRLDECSRRTEEKLGKGAGRDKDLVTQYQKQADILVAQIDRQTSGEVQHHGSVLCCQAHQHQAEDVLQHTHVTVTSILM